MILSQWTQKLVFLLLQIAETAKKENKRYYLGGGFSIDLSLGKITRQHEDLDFYPDEKDTEFWKMWFKDNGFMIEKGVDMKQFPNAFKPRIEKNGKGLVDAYPVYFYPDGRVGMLGVTGEHGVWHGKNWNDNRVVNYKDVDIWIENPTTVIQQKLDHVKKYQIPLLSKHQHDIKNFDRYLK